MKKHYFMMCLYKYLDLECKREKGFPKKFKPADKRRFSSSHTLKICNVRTNSASTEARNVCKVIQKEKNDVIKILAIPFDTSPVN